MNASFRVRGAQTGAGNADEGATLMWCGDQDFEDEADWYYKQQKDFSVCDAQGATCFSCGKKIEQGATCVRFERWRYPTEEECDQGMEEWEEISMDPIFHCEECGEIYLNLTSLGYGVDISNMRGELEEYWGETGFDPKKWIGHFQNGNNHE